MATTTGGSTYVTSTDLVANYPTASLALANRVDVVASGSISKKTASYTVTVADILAGTTICMNSATATVITLPSTGLVNGMTLEVMSVNTGAVTFTGGTVTGSVTSITVQYARMRLTYDSVAAVWWSAPFGNSGAVKLASAVFTGASSASLTSVFTTGYNFYRLYLRLLATSTATDVYIRMRSGGTDSSGAFYIVQNLLGTVSSATANLATGQTVWKIGATTALYGNLNTWAIDIYNPMEALPTFATASGYSTDAAGTPFTVASAYQHAVSAAFDGISILPSAGTLSGEYTLVGFIN